MAMNEQTGDELRRLTAEIGRDPRNSAAYLDRAKLYYRSGMFGEAANDFARVLEIEPDNTEAAQYLVMIGEIQSYRYTDLLNP